MVGALTDLFDGCHIAQVLSSNACTGCAVPPVHWCREWPVGLCAASPV